MKYGGAGRVPRVIILVSSAIAVGFVCTALWYVQRNSGELPSASPRSIPSPEVTIRISPPPVPIRPSRFQNADPNETYAGMDRCIGCHGEQYDSYLHTEHSRALADIDPNAEPPDGHFHHERSGRDYRVFREGDRFLHRESLPIEGDTAAMACEYPVAYVIGSGHHSRSYLIDADGFLAESPITWYAAKRNWGMSPGYDRATHDSFERAVDFGCLYCHAGRVEARDVNRYRVQLHEKTIGCESCHGPGLRHARYRESLSDQPVGEDTTIVNPARLERELAESICAQCHMRGAASVFLRGRSPSDFRPGLHLSDFRVEYMTDPPNAVMKVVGHVEQMRQSACYRQSDTMTCTTCHDPHRILPAEERVAFFRDRCNACHQGHCGLDEPSRQRRAANNCVQCHMPQSPTDIPHFAFTHHRVGIHPASDAHAASTESPDSRSSATDPEAPVQLIPMSDVSRLPDVEKARCLGLAYFEWAEKQSSPRLFRIYRERVRTLLHDVFDKGIRDAATASTLARCYWEDGEWDQAELYANQALQAEPDLMGSHTNARIILADIYMQTQRWRLAEDVCERLTSERRHSQDWFSLAVCRMRRRDLPGAAAAAKKSLEIHPYRAETHELMASLLLSTGETSRAQEHQRLAVRLRGR